MVATELFLKGNVTEMEFYITQFTAETKELQIFWNVTVAKKHLNNVKEKDGRETHGVEV